MLKTKNEPHAEITQGGIALAHVYLIKWLYDGGGPRQLELIRII